MPETALASRGNAPARQQALDADDRRIIAATQSGLPLVERPYHALAEQLGLSPEEIMRRMRAMLKHGVIRRIAAVPNHYRLGYTHNAMTVWDVADDAIPGAGQTLAGLAFVTHCYHRPRHLPEWPYNLFAMVHGHSAEEVDDKVETMAALLGDRARGHTLLYSTRILKKTGMRI